jgi:predicted type IV restriction endonuclease
MDHEAVQEYVDQSLSLLETSPQMDEANTKAAVLRDFLELLDWEIPTNTQLEYSVKAFGQTYKVDYALILEGTPVAFLEAKGVDTALTAAHDEQLSSYMMNKNVNYGILTNGKQYKFLQRRVDASNVQVQTVGDVQLRNLPDRLAILRAYTKEAIQSGESGKILGRINELREARSILEAEKDDLATDLTTVLTDTVSNTISSLAESQSKEMIDRLIQDIESEIDSDETLSSAEEGDAGPRASSLEDTPSASGELTEGNQWESTDGISNQLAANHIAGTIRRAEIEGDGDARVAVFPAMESGLRFLKENNAWGFVRVGREFEYVAMYVSRDVGEVRYFATVKDAVSPDEAELVHSPEEYVDRAKIAGDKMVVRFEPDSLYELEDSIPYKTKYPRSLRYTTLDALRTAETTEDML